MHTRRKAQRPAHASSASVAQFGIAEHYDAITQLDAPVHLDEALAAAEVELALGLCLGGIPRSVFLPCGGIGRHIAPLLEQGVERIMLVDLSPASVAIARQKFGEDPRISIEMADLTAWTTDECFDAVFMLGNSFGDLIHDGPRRRMNANITRFLRRTEHGMPTSVFVMDYIGTDYLDRCDGSSSEWESPFNGTTVRDIRTPRYDPRTGVMTIDIRALDGETAVYEGSYQKRILDQIAVMKDFEGTGLSLAPFGFPHERSPYFATRNDLGMIAKSTWWQGVRAS